MLLFLGKETPPLIVAELISHPQPQGSGSRLGIRRDPDRSDQGHLLVVGDRTVHHRAVRVHRLAHHQPRYGLHLQKEVFLLTGLVQAIRDRERDPELQGFPDLGSLRHHGHFQRSLLAPHHGRGQARDNQEENRKSVGESAHHSGQSSAPAAGAMTYTSGSNPVSFW